VKKLTYLFDTHALIFWTNKEAVSEDFINFFDKQEQQGCLYISSISFWEIALLVKHGRLTISDAHVWKNEILENTNIRLTDPSVSEMIDSVLLPDIHKDPFDSKQSAIDYLMTQNYDDDGFYIIKGIEV
jgi:PIN domain nuclease of toxin-antitoxin system